MKVISVRNVNRAMQLGVDFFRGADRDWETPTDSV